mmetsp:Transcript_6754/g.16920  ORF Transcript_6754/g.16920 Transcript_6754/m.16920 type:complete len:505 (-) Transcript_6754:60-1574(-)
MSASNVSASGSEDCDATDKADAAMLNSVHTTASNSPRQASWAEESDTPRSSPREAAPDGTPPDYGDAQGASGRARHRNRRGSSGAAASAEAEGGQQKPQQQQLQQQQQRKLGGERPVRCRTRTDPVPWGADVVTVMVRQVPRHYTQLMFLKEVNTRGFAGLFNFMYLPCDLKKGINVGYGFLSFTQGRHAQTFRQEFDGAFLDEQMHNRGKPLRVHPAAVQGYEANYKHFMQTKTGQKQDPEFSPLFFLWHDECCPEDGEMKTDTTMYDFAQTGQCMAESQGMDASNQEFGNERQAEGNNNQEDQFFQTVQWNASTPELGCEPSPHMWIPDDGVPRVPQEWFFPGQCDGMGMDQDRLYDEDLQAHHGQWASNHSGETFEDCVRCGAPQPEENNFCARCGHRMGLDDDVPRSCLSRNPQEPQVENGKQGNPGMQDQYLRFQYQLQLHLQRHQIMQQQDRMLRQQQQQQLHPFQVQQHLHKLQQVPSHVQTKHECCEVQDDDGELW